jgi:DNA damage-binding protein 1
VSYVFAACDRPTIIYSQNRKLIYSNLNEGEVRGCGDRQSFAWLSANCSWVRVAGQNPVKRAAQLFHLRPHPLVPSPPSRQVNFMAPFNSASFPDSLAIAKEDSLTLGTIDAIQKLHVRTVPLGEQPRRLALQEATRTLGVATAGLLGGMGRRC